MYTYDERLVEAKKIMGKYPERLPVIVERSAGCQLKHINKNKSSMISLGEIYNWYLELPEVVSLS